MNLKFFITIKNIELKERIVFHIMLQQIVKINKNNSVLVFKPSECNYCNKGVDLIVCNACFIHFYSELVLCVLYKCPICQQIILCKYQLPQSIINNFDIPISPFETLGGVGINKEFSNEIKELSPSFVKIFNDSYKAEQAGLTEIVGLGYRRAFEFLIKDYVLAKENTEENKETVKSLQLSNLINNYFPDGEIKELLSRATWIGNDFAHYEAKHSDINLEDLKQLILLSVSKIDESIKTKKYIEKIQRK